MRTLLAGILLVTLFALVACQETVEPPQDYEAVGTQTTSGDGIVTFEAADVEIVLRDLVSDEAVAGAYVTLLEGEGESVVAVIDPTGVYNPEFVVLTPEAATADVNANSAVVAYYTLRLLRRPPDPDSPAFTAGELPSPFLRYLVNNYTTCSEMMLSEAQDQLFMAATVTTAEHVTLIAITGSLVMSGGGAPAGAVVGAYSAITGATSSTALLGSSAQVMYYSMNYSPTDQFKLCWARDWLAQRVVDHAFFMYPVAEPDTAPIATSALGGMLTDAVSLEPIGGAHVRIAGPSPRTTLTDDSGAFSFDDIISGVYSITATKSGFVPTSASVDVAPLSSTVRNLSMSRGLGDEEIRIILTWGDTPRDLDSHLWTPVIDSTAYRIAYYSRGSLTAPPYALLDIDVVTSYGPETITVTRRFPGTYVYAVHNFTDGGDSTSDRLRNVSGAMVEVIAGDGLLGRYVVTDAAGSEGTWWHLLELDGATGTVNLINQIRPDAPSPSGLGASQGRTAQFAKEDR